MSSSLILSQLLNGLQLGVLLFLLAAGLTLVFGIMSFVNLAHGSLYMLGAYFGAYGFNRFGSLFAALCVAAGGCIAVGLILERVVVSRLYSRSHLDHVLATFGLVMFFSELSRLVWGPTPYFVSLPAWLGGSVEVFGFSYSSYRLSIIGIGLAVAVGSYLLIHKTRLGMLIRAGSVNPRLVGALGININLLNGLLFALGAALAGIAGAMAGPILAIQADMGDTIIVTTLVVIVIGGIGSVSGAFYAALIVGLVDTLGRAYIPMLLRELTERSFANAAGPALASMSVYLLMAIVLAVKPQGLFPRKT